MRRRDTDEFMITTVANEGTTFEISVKNVLFSARKRRRTMGRLDSKIKNFTRKILYLVRWSSGRLRK